MAEITALQGAHLVLYTQQPNSLYNFLNEQSDAPGLESLGGWEAPQFMTHSSFFFFL